MSRLIFFKKNFFFFSKNFFFFFFFFFLILSATVVIGTLRVNAVKFCRKFTQVNIFQQRKIIVIQIINVSKVHLPSNQFSSPHPFQLTALVIPSDYTFNTYDAMGESRSGQTDDILLIFLENRI